MNKDEQLYHKIIELARSGAANEARDLCIQLPQADPTNTAIVSSALIETAFALETAGDLQSAAHVYSRLIADNAAVPAIQANALFRRGAILGHMGRIDESLAALEAAGSQSDNLLIQRTALYHLAAALASQGRHEIACGYLERLVSLPGEEPSELAARLKLIHCRVRAGVSIGEIPCSVDVFSPLEAAAWMEAVFSLERTADEGLPAIQDRFRAAASMKDDVRGQALWHLALGTLSAYASDAPALAGRLLEYDGADRLGPMLWAKAIECLAHKSDLASDEIQPIWDKMPAKCSSDLAGAMMLAAFTLEQRGHLAAAQSGYERLTSKDGLPHAVLANAHFRLGITLDSLGHWTTAVAHYSKASEHADSSDPIRAEARLRVAQAKQMEEEFDAAAELYRTLRDDILLSEAKRSKAQLQYGMCLLRGGNRDAALPELDRCRAVSSDEISLAAEVALAEIFEASHDKKSACECYQRVLNHPQAQPLERTAALTRLKRLGR